MGGIFSEGSRSGIDVQHNGIIARLASHERILLMELLELIGPASLGWVLEPIFSECGTAMGEITSCASPHTPPLQPSAPSSTFEVTNCDSKRLP